MKRQAGFSLSELLVVMAIVAILMAIGLPSYTSITNSYRISAEVNNLLGDMMYTRGEAIKEGQTVSICVSKNGTTCDAGSVNWQEGWIVFQDPGATGAWVAGDTIYKVQSTFSSADTFVANNGVTSVTFNREGFTSGAAFAGTTITLHDKTANSFWTRCFILQTAGLMTTSSFQNQTNGACGP
jgi:type IV fimbrial biogenesis protein FimT